jgi:hypothetical protein
MLVRRLNNWVVIATILCSTSIYQLTLLGNKMQKGAEMAGIVLIVGAIIISLAYSGEKPVRQHFILPIVLILLSLVSSMFMAYYSREQPLGETLYAQRAVYYYLFYFMLHQLRIEARDLERIIIAFALVHVALYLLQFFAYPTILFDAYIRADRGTIRIYLTGGDYMSLALYFGVQHFFRSNRFLYLWLVLLILVIFILMGGRQVLATIALMVVIFLFFDRRIKSRFFLIFMGAVAAVAGFFIFQDIFEALFQATRSNAAIGENYIRLRASEFYLTDFFRSPLAYLTGNGAFATDSNYGKEIAFNAARRQFFLGDIGIIGNYAIYGAFFVAGVLMILFRALKIRIEADYHYVKLMFASMALSIVISAGFTSMDTICFIAAMMYLVDATHEQSPVPARGTLPIKT